LKIFTIRNNDGNAVNMDMYGAGGSDGRANISFIGEVISENNSFEWNIYT
jgi:hypothetical protein